MTKFIKRKFGYTDEEWSWILYDVANSVFVLTVMSVLFAFILGEHLGNAGIEGETTYFASVANMVYSIIIAVLAPILGTMSDYLGFKKKFFVTFLIIGLIGGIGVAVGINYVFVIVAFVIAMIGFAGANIFYDAFLPDVTEENNYHKISSHGFAWGYIGSVLPFLIIILPFALSYTGILNLEPLIAMGTSVALSIIWWGLFSLPFIKNVKSKSGIPVEKKIIKKSFGRMIRTVKDMAKNNKNILLFLVAYSFYIDTVNSIISLAVAMMNDLGLSPILGLAAVIALQFLAFPCAIIFAGFTKKYGPKNMIIAGLIIYCFVIYTVVKLFSTNPNLYIWVIVVLISMAQGGIQGVSRSMFGTLITDKNKSGEYFGFFNIFGKFATLTGPLAIVVGRMLVPKLSSATDNIYFLIPSMIIGFTLFLFVKENNGNQKIA